MEKLNIYRPLRAQAIYLKGNSKPLRDRIIFVSSNFLIVGKDINDTAPTWYNIDLVNRLEGVEPIDGPRHNQQIRFFA